jgi:plastocyanin
MNRLSWIAAVALSAGACTASFGQITGTVKLDGKAPKRAAVAGVAAVPACAALHKDPLLDETIVADDGGNLANVVVFIKADNLKGEVPKEPAVIDQKGCQYDPHVVAMMVGQDLVAKNSDPFLHNVHTLPENSEPDNRAQPNKDAGQKLKPVKAAEIFHVKCDVHPWMSAWVAAFNHPFFAVSGDDGSYSIDTKGLKDGSYTLVAWQEKFKESAPQKITVKGGKAEANFTFKQKTAAADKTGAPVKDVTLASLTTKDCCEDCDSTAKVQKTSVAVSK